MEMKRVWAWAGGAAIVAGIAIRWRGKVNARCAEAKYPPQGQFLAAEGCRLHFIRRGSGQPVVLLHGSDGFAQDFAALLDEPSAIPFELIALDRPGHGYSEALRGTASLSEQARCIHSALQQMNVKRPLLVGHSWSAALCLCYALDYPQDVAGLVLLSPWVYPTADPPPLLLYAAYGAGKFLAYSLLLLTPLKKWLLRSSLQQAFFPAPVPAAYEQEAFALWQRTPAQVGAFLQENVAAWRQLSPLAPRYPQIQVPVWILTGDSDHTVHAESHARALHSALPHSELQIVPQTGHELPHVRPSIVRQAIVQMWEKEQLLPSHVAPLSTKAISLPSVDARDKARELVFRFGWNATAYQILNPDITHWFTPDGDAVVGYVRRFKRRVAAGAPVCDEARLAEVTALFEQDAAEKGERVCWFGATTRLQSALMPTLPHAAWVIGGQPVWNPAHWQDILKKNSSLRAQLNRARNKGVEVEEWTEERAAGNAGLQRCLDEWLAHHPLPTLHFLTEPVTLDRLADRRIWVAAKEDVPQGFLIATPVPSRSGWLIEQIVRSTDAPNGTAELMVDAAMKALAADGFAYVTLGLVPLTPRIRTGGTPPRFWLRTALTWARLHGQRFYNFEGLDAFKAKFKPETWEPLFALSNESRVSVQTLMAIAAAFSNEPLPLAAARALFAAARQEVLWLTHRPRTKSTPK